MIIALVSQKGGVAKSTLSAAIAWEMQARGLNVLVVDSDPQGTVRTTGEVAAELGVSAPSIVALGRDMYRPEQLPRLAQSYDHVVIDTPGRMGDVQRAALMVADLALIPIGQSAADAWASAATVDLVKEAQVTRPGLRVALVITRCAPRTVLGRGARDVAAESGLPVLKTETSFRIAWQESLPAGLGVAQYAPKDRSAEEARGLVDELLEIGEKKKARRARHGR